MIFKSKRKKSRGTRSIASGWEGGVLTATAKHGTRANASLGVAAGVRLSACLGLQYDRSDDVGGTLVNNREKIHAVYLFSHSRQLGKCSTVSESLLYIVTVFLWEWSRHEISIFLLFHVGSIGGHYLSDLKRRLEIMGPTSSGSSFQELS